MTFDFERGLVACMPDLQRYARHLARDAARAEDLVQDCMERALRHRQHFAAGTNLRAWLCTILKNLHLNSVRHARRVVDTPLADDLVVAAPAQEWQVSLREAGEAFARLSPAHRQVMRMMAIEGRGYHETAARLRVPVGTVRSRLARARDQLRAAAMRRTGVARQPGPQPQQVVRPVPPRRAPESEPATSRGGRARAPAPSRGPAPRHAPTAATHGVPGRHAAGAGRLHLACAFLAGAFAACFAHPAMTQDLTTVGPRDSGFSLVVAGAAANVGPRALTRAVADALPAGLLDRRLNFTRHATYDPQAPYRIVFLFHDADRSFDRDLCRDSGALTGATRQAKPDFRGLMSTVALKAAFCRGSATLATAANRSIGRVQPTDASFRFLVADTAKDLFPDGFARLPRSGQADGTAVSGVRPADGPRR